MATLITGQSQQLTLQPSDKYAVTVGANTEAYIDLGAGTDGSGYDSVRLTSEGTNKYTIGEYGRVAKVTIRCVVGGVSYEKEKKSDSLANSLNLKSSSGVVVKNFAEGVGIATSVATQSSCVANWLSDGLELIANTDGFSEFRMYFDSTKSFDLYGEDGFAVDFSIESIAAKSNPGFSIEFGKGATSTSTPTDRTAYKLIHWPTGTPYISGDQYIRWRPDSLATDAKCSPWPTVAPAASGAGAGVGDGNKLPWLRFTMSNLGGVKIKIRRLIRGGKATPVIVLGTDTAASYPLLELANAYFAKKSIPWSINQYFGGGTGVDDLVVSQNVINGVYAAGNDFNINDLVDRPLATAGLTRSQVADMARSCIQKAVNYGWAQGTNIYVYNNNSFNDDVVNGLADAGVIAARGGVSTGRFVFTEGGVVNPLRLPAAGWDQLTSSAMIAQIDRAIEYGATVWIYWHNVFSRARVIADGQPDPAALTPSAYAATNPTYCAARGIDQYCVWWEELKPVIDHIAAKKAAGDALVMTPSAWCDAFGL